MNIDRKVVLLKDAKVTDAGRLEGYGAVYGNVDDGGDILEQGSLEPAVAGFLQSGFISWGHDWGVPVAMPKEARSDERGLFIAADFHSTPTAQEKRTITSERLAAGLTMGLSIGYGDITAKRGPEARSISEVRRLYEVGLVMVPMNQEAGVADVKGVKAAADNVSRATYCLTTINDLIESEALDAENGDANDQADVDVLVAARDWLLDFIASESGQVGTTGDLEQVRAEDAARAALWSDYGWMGQSRAPFATHIESIETGLKALIARSHAVARLRKEGQLSSTNRSRLEGLAKTLAATEVDIRGLLASTEPDTQKASRAAEIELLLAEAAEFGIPTTVAPN